MNKPLAALLAAAVTSLSSAALAANATVTGPLGDNQIVRGKKLGMSYLHYGANGADPSAVVTVHYGFHGDNNEASVVMSPTGYGNQATFLDVPGDATGFWYTLTVSDGTVQSNQGAPFALRARDRAVSVTRSSPGASTILVRYSGPVQTTYDTYLHLGWNNWNDVGDAFMTRSEFSYFKAGVYYDYDYAYVDPPWWANYLDFVFKDARGGGTWDNNGGADWHQSLHPFVTTSVTDTGMGTVYVNVQYQDGALNPVQLHWGLDAWSSSGTQSMNAYSGIWQTSLTVPSTSTELEMAFTDGAGQWDNNYGTNWNISLP